MKSAPPRKYESPLRLEKAAETRATILDAAARLFVERGWAGTSMRDIAREAGCAVETVYSSIGNKREVLKIVLDVAVVGDDEPIPFLERPQLTAIGEGDLSKRAAAMGAFVASVLKRTALLHLVLQEAARTDPALAELAEQHHADHRTSVQATVTSVARRPLTTDESDEMQALLSNEMYLLLTRQSGWTDSKYRTWLATSVVKQLELTEE
jgi:AcrR family transcriptional regulator